MTKDDFDALDKTRGLYLDNQREYQAGVSRFLNYRLVGMLLAVGVLSSYDLSVDTAADRNQDFNHWFDTEMTPHLEEFDDQFHYADFRQPTEAARKRIAQIVTPAVMNLAMASAYGGPEEPRLGRAFYYLKTTRYHIDIFNYKTITSLLKDLEPKKNESMKSARSGLEQLIKQRNLLADHPGLQQSVQHALDHSGTVAQFSQTLDTTATAERSTTETQYADEIDAWRAIDRLDSNWYSWRYTMWNRLTDASYRSFRSSLVSIGDDGLNQLVELKDEAPFGAAVRKIHTALAQADADRKAKSLANLSFLSISFAVSKRVVLFVLPFLFALSTLMSGMLKLRARMALIWVAALERKLAKLSAGVLPTVSVEALNAHGTYHYIRKRQWSRLFENSPALFLEASHSVVAWGMYFYLAALPWLAVDWTQRASIVSTSAWTGTLFGWTALLVGIRFVLRQRVLERALDATGERTDRPQPAAAATQAA